MEFEKWGNSQTKAKILLCKIQIQCVKPNKNREDACLLNLNKNRFNQNTKHYLQERYQMTKWFNFIKRYQIYMRGTKKRIRHCQTKLHVKTHKFWKHWWNILSWTGMTLSSYWWMSSFTKKFKNWIKSNGVEKITIKKVVKAQGPLLPLHLPIDQCMASFTITKQWIYVKSCLCLTIMQTLNKVS